MLNSWELGHNFDQYSDYKLMWIDWQNVRRVDTHSQINSAQGEMIIDMMGLESETH